MDPFEIIRKYYKEGTEIYDVLVTHSKLVADKALQIAQKNSEENFDLEFVYEAAMLHDIGIYMTNAQKIYCKGTFPYICHGYLGSEIVNYEGFPKHALVCERHTGTGLSVKDIERLRLPSPHREMLPISKEEQLICYADKFFSKTDLYTEKSVDRVRASLSRFGEETIARFDCWLEKWGK